MVLLLTAATTESSWNQSGIHSSGGETAEASAWGQVCSEDVGARQVSEGGGG